MRSLNLFRKLGVREEVFANGKIDSIVEIEREIRQGVLLCDLVSLVFNVKINGVFREPRTENTCLANIRKGLEVLRRQRKLSQKFTWAEKLILQANRHVVLGLFEDIHRCYSGLAARKRGLNYFDDGPFLGQREAREEVSSYN